MRAIPPPLWCILLLAATYGLSAVPGLNQLPSLGNTPAGIVLVVAALLLLLTAANQFRLADTQILPNSPTNNKLVTGGVFRLTRNPMYLGMVLFCAGGAFLFGRIPMLLVPIVMFAVANWAFIPFEEAKMRRQFGDEFDAYVKRVRRWI